MLTTLSYLLGGTGLFLAGMILMSDGLRAAAGSALQHVLERSTRTPISGFFTGIGTTVLVQSSSATTVATIGFVSAGLLPFTSAVGLIVGANVGTTSTGWIVSTLGFKVDVALIALPFIGVGSLLRLLSAGRRAHLGMALVGFGLIFVGIEYLQSGMGGVAARIDLSDFSTAGAAGRLALVAVGAVMTVLLQSSSAAVAVTLTALGSGAIDIEQSAYLVIGQNLGTTVTAALASIGASVPARRTAAVHIIFNSATALLALLFTGYLLALVRLIAGADGDPAVQIALFHTVFNVAGAVLALPVTDSFARLAVRLVPDRGPQLTRHLDRSLLGVPDVAVEAASRALREIAAVMLGEARARLAGAPRSRAREETQRAAAAALQTTVDFLSRVDAGHMDQKLLDRRLSLFHAADHLARLDEAYLEDEAALEGTAAREAASRIVPAIEEAIVALRMPERDVREAAVRARETSERQADARRAHRAELLRTTAAGRLLPADAHRQLESMRWVDRVAYHVGRALHHLAGDGTAVGFEADVYGEPDEPPRSGAS